MHSENGLPLFIYNESTNIIMMNARLAAHMHSPICGVQYSRVGQIASAASWIREIPRYSFCSLLQGRFSAFWAEIFPHRLIDWLLDYLPRRSSGVKPVPFDDFYLLESWVNAIRLRWKVPLLDWFWLNDRGRCSTQGQLRTGVLLGARHAFFMGNQPVCKGALAFVPCIAWYVKIVNKKKRVKKMSVSEFLCIKQY